MTHRKLTLIFSLVLSSLLNFYPLSSVADTKDAQAPQGQLIDRIVAIVNDEIILKSELDKKVQLTEQDLAARHVKISDFHQLESKVLDNLIMEKLQLQRIKERGIEVQDEEVLAQIQQIAKQNSLTVLELRDRLNLSQPNGFQLFRDNVREKMLFEKLRQVAVLSQIQVTEDEIDNYLQRQNLVQNNFEYHLGHIMIDLPESATPDQRNAAKQKAQEVLTKLRDGEDFSQMAVRYSQGNKALSGGDLGWLTTDQIPTFFAQTVDQLTVGQTSDLIRSPVGYHIIKLLGKREKGSKLVKQYHLYRFILLSDNAKNKVEPPAALVQLANKITSLEAFKNLNKQYSDIPASVNAQGNLGWQTIQQMPLEYTKAIVGLKPHQAAKPFATEQGWNILYLDEIRDEDLNASNKRQQAMQTLRSKKANESYEIWLRRLRDDAIIDNRLDAKQSSDDTKESE